MSPNLNPIAAFRRKQRWSRRSRWTATLLNQREFQRALSKERSRVDRNGNCFGFIILRLESLTAARTQTVRLGKLLHRRLRDTDEKGHLGLGRIGLLLPETAGAETDRVMNDILKLASEQNLQIDAESFVYPDKDESGDHSDSDWSTVLPDKVVQSRTGFAGSNFEEVLKSNKSNESVSHHSMLMEAAFPYPRWKRAIDVAGASAGLLLGAPLLAAAALAVKSTSSGPVLFTQSRTGYLGRPFEIYKIRTMVANAEELKADLQESNERDGPAFKMKRDPRITTVGRFLRATGLDELPQLLNVLRGDMAIVGPRPLPIDEAAQCNAWQKRREEVKPGLTCFWQIAKSRQISFTEWMRLDLAYAQRSSPWLDIRLILRTVVSVVLGRVGH